MVYDLGVCCYNEQENAQDTLCAWYVSGSPMNTNGSEPKQKPRHHTIKENIWNYNPSPPHRGEVGDEFIVTRMHSSLMHNLVHKTGGLEVYDRLEVHAVGRFRLLHFSRIQVRLELFVITLGAHGLLLHRLRCGS